MGKKGKFAKGALFGALVGAALGLLYAPAEGSETRKKLKAESKKLKTKAEPKVKEAVKIAKGASKKATPVIQKEVTKAKEMLSALATELEKNFKKKS